MITITSYGSAKIADPDNSDSAAANLLFSVAEDTARAVETFLKAHPKATNINVTMTIHASEDDPQ